MKGFQIAQGTVLGRDHYMSRLNNQDGRHVIEEPDITVAIVSDGCGDKVSSQHSEVGAIYGSKITARFVHRYARLALGKYGSIPLNQKSFWEGARQDVLAQIRVQAMQMGDNFVEEVLKHYLFTVVGVLMYEKETAFFTLGDGVVYVNEEEIHVGPFPNNEPPYMGLALLDPGIVKIPQDLLSIKVHRIIKTSDLKSFLLATDGLDKFKEAENKPMPGKKDLVGPIRQFWADDRYFQNEFAIQRKLMLVTQDYMANDWDHKRVIRENGHLKDDTTIVVGRRH